MQIRQIMDCHFAICRTYETASVAVQLMVDNQTSYIVVIDEKNTYQGVVTAHNLLAIKNFDVPAERIMSSLRALKEDDLITSIRPSDFDIIPVINHLNNVVGILSMKSAFHHLPELLTNLDTGRSSNTRRLLQVNAKYTINDIVGRSKAILQLKEQIIATAKTKSTVLIMGETGTGKELVAHSIHRLSNRRHNPFIRVNCAAIPDNLLESELFGYEAGAFTGAVKGGQVGKFEAADGGTIFLDEIGDMPLSLQAKILRVLQEKEIEKVGGRVPIPIDIRIIAATHRHLRDLVREQKFREDLYYRLHVIPIQMPSLREHREDIPLLVDFFLAKQADELDIKKPDIDRDCMAALIKYDWPGNVRELANVIEMASSMCHGTITPAILPPSFKAEILSHSTPSMDEDASLLRNFSSDAEKEAIIKALELFNGNKLKVCDSLGISRSSLYNKLKKYNIEV